MKEIHLEYYVSLRGRWARLFVPKFPSPSTSASIAMHEVIKLDRIPAPPVVEVGTIKPALTTGFVSIDAAALYLGMGKRFVERLLFTGEVPSYKFGRARRIRLADLEQWASDNRES